LGCDDVGEDFATGAGDGGCSFVAGGLDAQDEAGAGGGLGRGFGARRGHRFYY
jgi:hypothetical protein